MSWQRMVQTMKKL